LRLRAGECKSCEEAYDGNFEEHVDEEARGFE
jgi:hypothetical protein